MFNFSSTLKAMTVVNVNNNASVTQGKVYSAAGVVG